MALSELWLPAAYVPVAIDSPDFKVRYQGSSATLIVDTNLPSSDNQTYTVRSVAPDLPGRRPPPGQHRRSRRPSAADLAVPGLSANARAIAKQVTADATTPYDKALALQSYFRDPRLFTYDTTVNFANDDNAIDTFLRVRRGYCQQFAGTFAALARSVGLPTRVAVGFTQGQSDPTNPSRYEVKGGQAHAWPEVYLGQYGWVPFEPTPGRGAPGEATYLGIPPAQNDNPGGGPTSTLPKTSTTPSTAPLTVPTVKPDNKLKTEPTPTATGHHSGVDLASWTSAIALVLLVAALLYAAVVPALYALRPASPPGARPRSRRRGSRWPGSSPRRRWPSWARPAGPTRPPGSSPTGPRTACPPSPPSCTTSPPRPTRRCSASTSSTTTPPDGPRSRPVRCAPWWRSSDRGGAGCSPTSTCATCASISPAEDADCRGDPVGRPGGGYSSRLKRSRMRWLVLPK